MVNLSDLFQQSNSILENSHWERKKEDVSKSIDVLMARGTVDSETLQIMKELLDLYRPVTMEDYMEDN